MRTGGILRIAPALVLAAVPLACSAGNDKDGGPGKLNPGNDDGGISLEDGGFVGDASTDGETCANATYTGKKIPASLLVLLDKSGSMADDGKWTAAVKALDAAFAKADDALPVGLLLFPEGKFSLPPQCLLSPSSTGCPAAYADNGCKDIRTTPDVAVAPLSTSRSAIEAKLASAKPDGDTTPTRWALKNSWAHMAKIDAKGDRYVVLVTDGEPTTHQPPFAGYPEMSIECADTKTIEAETLAASSGTPAVKTFVIGAPGSEKAAPHLSQIAWNGKAPRSPDCTPSAGDCHYAIGSAAFEADLAKAIEEITGKIATCIFEVPTGTDVDPEKVNVTVESGGASTDLYRDTSHADGWDYTDDTHTRVELHGPACDDVKKNSDSAKVQILLGCKTRVK